MSYKKSLKKSLIQKAKKSGDPALICYQFCELVLNPNELLER